MPHPFQHTEGIVLRAIPFQDYDHILTLFTPEAGIMKLLVHGSRSKRRSVQGLCMPLTKVSAVYQEKRGEIFSCRELALLEPFSHLRNDLPRLEAACDVLDAISRSQLAGKPAPLLYTLLCFILERIPHAPFPIALATCYRLKLLKHEGLAVFPFVCSDCGQILLTEAYTRSSEGWCSNHRPAGSSRWSQESLETIYRFSASQSVREICAEEAAPHLHLQVTRFFDACLEA